MNPFNPFLTAFEWVVAAEGGFVNLPQDPGGATKYGVSLRAVRLRDADKDGRLDFDLDKDGDVDVSDIKLVTVEHAQRFYREDYWSLKGAGSSNMLSCDSLPYAWGIAVFDTAILQGPRTAVALMQRSVGIADADGILGPKTLDLVRKASELEGLGLFAALRLDRMRKHPEADTFFKGWAKRIAILHQRLGRSIKEEGNP